MTLLESILLGLVIVFFIIILIFIALYIIINRMFYESHKLLKDYVNNYGNLGGENCDNPTNKNNKII